MSEHRADTFYVWSKPATLELNVDTSFLGLEGREDYLINKHESCMETEVEKYLYILYLET